MFSPTHNNSFSFNFNPLFCYFLHITNYPVFNVSHMVESAFTRKSSYNPREKGNIKKTAWIHLSWISRLISTGIFLVLTIFGYIITGDKLKPSIWEQNPLFCKFPCLKIALALQNRFTQVPMNVANMLPIHLKIISGEESCLRCRFLWESRCWKCETEEQP